MSLAMQGQCLLSYLTTLSYSLRTVPAITRAIVWASHLYHLSHSFSLRVKALLLKAVAAQSWGLEFGTLKLPAIQSPTDSTPSSGPYDCTEVGVYMHAHINSHRHFLNKPLSGMIFAIKQRNRNKRDKIMH